MSLKQLVVEVCGMSDNRYVIWGVNKEIKERENKKKERKEKNLTRHKKDRKR